MLNKAIEHFPYRERVIVDYSIQNTPESIIDSSYEDSNISNQATYSQNENNDIEQYILNKI